MTSLRLFLIPVLALGLAACATDAPADETDATASADTSAAMSTEPVMVGEAPDADAGFLLASDVDARAEELNGSEIAVEGTISEVCQQAGCWLTIHNPDGTPFRVVVPKDADGAYVFTFPRDVTGALAQLAGTFSVEEESVETLRHLAEDAGEDAEAIAAITEPKRTLVLTASGARVMPAAATPTTSVSSSAPVTVRAGGARCSACPMHSRTESATVNA